MIYSVYILKLNENTNNNDLLTKFASDGSFLKHFGKAAIDAASSIVDLDLYDPVADKVADDEVAIRASMIKSMNIKSEYIFATPLEGGTTKPVQYQQATITVVGRLYMPLSLGTVVKKKDTAKLLSWSVVDPNGVNVEDDQLRQRNEKAYYRTVVATVYSSTDECFRAIILRKAYCLSYEESYNEEAEGTFTLTIVGKIDNATNVEVKGPEFKITALSVINQVSKTVSSVASKTKKTTEFVEKFTGETAATKAIKKISNTVDQGGQIFKSGVTEKGNFSSIIDTTDKTTQDIKNDYKDDKMKTDLETANEYNNAYDSLTPEAQKILLAVPNFSSMSNKEKLKYAKELAKKPENLKDTPPPVPTNNVNTSANSGTNIKNGIKRGLERQNEFNATLKKLSADEQEKLKATPNYKNMTLEEKTKAANKIINERK